MWAIFSQLTIWKKKENHKGCCCCWVGQVITINLFVTSKKRNHEFTNLACCIKASLFKPFFNGVLLLIYYFKKHFKHCFFISKALKDILQHFKFMNWWFRFLHSFSCTVTVKLGNKERFDKGQIGIKELFMDYQPFYTINLLLDKELLPI